MSAELEISPWRDMIDDADYFDADVNKKISSMLSHNGTNLCLIGCCCNEMELCSLPKDSKEQQHITSNITSKKQSKQKSKNKRFATCDTGSENLQMQSGSQKLSEIYREEEQGANWSKTANCKLQASITSTRR